MGDLSELGLQVAAHALCGRVGVVELGVARLQVLQLVHQQVEVVVADGGLVLYVVVVIMFVQLAAELRYAFCLRHPDVLEVN